MDGALKASFSRIDAAASDTLSSQIDALLPQTQCTKCGYAGCQPYADAIASGEAEINQCPPGGTAGIAKLAQLLRRAPLALNPVNGSEQPLKVAVIDESRCIGCTLCLTACPVDAILGAAKRMHTVIAAHCTGCDLCLPPCPMDCIAMVPVAAPRSWTPRDAEAARQRYTSQRSRRAAIETKSGAERNGSSPKVSVVAAAVQRARDRRALAAQ